ncbi:MAG: trehalose-6-phosphate synthase [Actinomycetota bacterium]|nr:trehalose-6-phosphate synthase [Actinomycetota bacterium]
MNRGGGPAGGGGTAKAKLVVASNRGPFALEERGDGSFGVRPGGGGLAPSLAAALEGRDDAVWVAAPLTATDRMAAERAGGMVEAGGDGLRLQLVHVGEQVLSSAYDVIANSTLWFCFHGLFDASRRPLFDRRFYAAWDDFRLYNEAFANAVAEVAAPGAVVLVNDYHLALAGTTLAEARPDLLSVHFSHTPFPGPEELAILPPAVRSELLGAMAGFGACGFHTARWESAFVRCCEQLGGKVPATFHAGLGADLSRLAEVASSPGCERRRIEIADRIGDRKLIVRSDRIELSKNLLRGFLAFDLLLEEHPCWRESVVMLARAYPSRQGLPEYLAYRAEVEHMAALLNERWATRGWAPVELDVDDDFASTVAALERYEVLLVNPIRDGMNLVAREGPALNERDGVLVLSTMAGAFEDLGGLSIGVHPFDVAATSEALHQALEMPHEERARRSSELKRRAGHLAPAAWLEHVLSEARSPQD